MPFQSPKNRKLPLSATAIVDKIHEQRSSKKAQARKKDLRNIQCLEDTNIQLQPLRRISPRPVAEDIFDIEFSSSSSLSEKEKRTVMEFYRQNAMNNYTYPLSASSQTEPLIPKAPENSSPISPLSQTTVMSADRKNWILSYGSVDSATFPDEMHIAVKSHLPGSPYLQSELSTATEERLNSPTGPHHKPQIRFGLSSQSRASSVVSLIDHATYDIPEESSDTSSKCTSFFHSPLGTGSATLLGNPSPKRGRSPAVDGPASDPPTIRRSPSPCCQYDSVSSSSRPSSPILSSSIRKPRAKECKTRSPIPVLKDGNSSKLAVAEIPPVYVSDAEAAPESTGLDPRRAESDEGADSKGTGKAPAGEQPPNAANGNVTASGSEPCCDPVSRQGVPEVKNIGLNVPVLGILTASENPDASATFLPVGDSGDAAKRGRRAEAKREQRKQLRERRRRIRALEKKQAEKMKAKQQKAKAEAKAKEKQEREDAAARKRKEELKKKQEKRDTAARKRQAKALERRQKKDAATKKKQEKAAEKQTKKGYGNKLNQAKAHNRQRQTDGTSEKKQEKLRKRAEKKLKDALKQRKRKGKLLFRRGVLVLILGHDLTDPVLDAINWVAKNPLPDGLPDNLPDGVPILITAPSLQ
jgi:hypothetical protein